MKHKRLQQMTAGALALALTATSCFLPAPPAEAVQTSTPKRVCVHDPSILKADGTYYVFGSHLADAKSTDMINWTQMNNDWNAPGRDWKNDSVYGATLTNLAESFEWAGYDDGDAAGGGLAVWAPDVKWNPDYAWSDGSTGAYMLYYSASSTWRRSCIGYAVSKKAEGPYQYVDTIIYSGFTTTGAYDGNSTRNTGWYSDALNIKELIANGTIEDINDRWFFNDGSYNTDYAPNAIDPTIFFDKEGAMYMVYGSWSGGLYILPIDKKTGAPVYPGRDGTDSVSGNRVDRYFGTHIAGGNHQSGEGPYILYDRESGYYYLYETYGGLLGSGGYNMRLFRSENVMGPYMDAMGRNAADNGVDNTRYGIKLIGNYKLSGMSVGYRAAGHNSALIDDDGTHYLIYHQRFSNNEFYHEIRIHKQFLNEEGWPVTAVFENHGEEISHYPDSDVTGVYEIINHGTSTDGNMIRTQKIELNADGTITGNLTGTWEKTTGKDYDYITIRAGGVTYRGVLFLQYDESRTPKQVMTFTSIGGNNTCLWGTRTGTPTNATPAPTPTAAPTAPAPTKAPTVTDAPAKTPAPTGTPAPAKTPDVTDEPEEKGDSGSAGISLKKPVLSVKAGKKQAVLKWKKVSGAKGYRIRYSEKKSMKSPKNVTVPKGSTLRKTIKKLKSKKIYYFRIRAYAKNGKKTVYSAYSAKKKCRIR